MTDFRFAIAAFAAATLGVHAADLVKGKAKAEQVCAACHNADGNSTNPQYPVLAGQHVDYLRKVLHDYQTGARNNAIMGAMAKPLTKAEIEDVTAWFASQQSVLTMKR